MITLKIKLCESKLILCFKKYEMKKQLSTSFKYLTFKEQWKAAFLLATIFRRYEYIDFFMKKNNGNDMTDAIQISLFRNMMELYRYFDLKDEDPWPIRGMGGWFRPRKKSKKRKSYRTARRLI